MGANLGSRLTVRQQSWVGTLLSSMTIYPALTLRIYKILIVVRNLRRLKLFGLLLLRAFSASPFLCALALAKSCARCNRSEHVAAQIEAPRH